MRILLIGVHYAPDEFGIAPFTAGLAEHLAGAGHHITVAAAFSTLRVALEGPNGIAIRRVQRGHRSTFPSNTQRKSTAAWRVTFDTSFALATMANTMGVDRCDTRSSSVASNPSRSCWRDALRRCNDSLILLVQDLPLDLACRSAC